MNKKAKAKEKRGKTALVAGGLAALTALGLTVGSLFDSPSDLLQDDPATVLVSVQPDAAPDGGDGGDGDAETLDESERKRRGGVKATLREQILSVPLALRLLVVLPLWLLGSGVSIFATALWTAASPFLEQLLGSLLLLAALFGAFLLAAKAIFPDLPLKKLLRPRTVAWLLLGGLTLSVTDQALLALVEGYARTRAWVVGGGFLVLLAVGVVGFSLREQKRRMLAVTAPTEDVPEEPNVVVFDAPGGSFAIRRDRGKKH